MHSTLHCVGVRDDPRERFMPSARTPRGESYVLRAPSPLPESGKAPSTFSREGGEAILVVDDEFDMLESLQSLLRLMLPKHRILVAHNAREALEILGREKVRLVLADYRMPGMTGIEMLREMELQGILVPSFLLTAFADSNLETEARKFPLIKGFFKKPIEPEALIRAAMQYCGAR